MRDFYVKPNGAQSHHPSFWSNKKKKEANNGKE